MPVISKTKPYFLNVDLEIESSSKLNLLQNEFGKRVLVMYSGPWPKAKHFLALEISGIRRGPDATVHVLCGLVEGLTPAARRIWNAAQKTFDIGYELRPSENSSRFTLRADTLQRIANLGATLAVTYYRGDSAD